MDFVVNNISDDDSVESEEDSPPPSISTAVKMTQVVFQVAAVTVPGETLCISGNSETLGCWRPESVVLMSRLFTPEDSEETDESYSGSYGDWTCMVTLPSEEDITYHYTIGRVSGEESLYNNNSSSPSQHDIVILRTEAHRIPRCFKTEGAKMSVSDEVFGIVSGHHCVYDGWLNPGTKEIRLIFNSWESPALTLIDNETEGGYRMKLKADEYSLVGEDGCRKCKIPEQSVPVNVQRSFSPEYRPQPQDMCGTELEDKEYITFSVVTFQSKHIELVLQFYNSCDELVAISYVLPDSMSGSNGSIYLPIISIKDSWKCIGKITIEYLNINSVCASNSGHLNNSYWCWWNRKRMFSRSLHIGHRGCGISYGTRNYDIEYEENTVESLHETYDRGCEFVEFDVILTKDFVPVLFHDYYILVHPDDPFNQEVGSDSDEADVDQLKPLHTESWKDNVKLDTLQEAMTDVCGDLGFLIELKFPQMDVLGHCEALRGHAYSDKNCYADMIIDHLISGALGRRCILTCFDADICVLLRKKQNSFPVMLVTQGDTKHYANYKDFRCRDTRLSVQMSIAEDFYGVSMNCENMLGLGHRDSGCVQLAHDSNLVVFTWGLELEKPGVFNLLEESLDVDGIIYDNPECRDVVQRDNLIPQEWSYTTRCNTSHRSNHV